MESELLHRLIVPAATKIVMIIMDGLGGLPVSPGGRTELETARTPNLDSLAARSNLGLTIPVAPGITAGSGPGHLGIFGYDPVQHEIGRGVMEALGVDIELGPDDLAARGNFCTVDAAGVLIDRRAGRLSSEASGELLQSLQAIHIKGAEFVVRLIKEHRFAFVLRGAGRSAALTDTDPQHTGVRPLSVRALKPGSEPVAHLINRFVEEASAVLAGASPANMILLRGFARYPHLPGFAERYGLSAAAIALNGMYRGVGRLVGMDVLPVTGATIADEFATLEQHWDAYDFFYLHVKETDRAAHDGDLARKIAVIELVDTLLPRALALEPDVVVVSGDHSTPAVLRAHSWHPVPTLLFARNVRPDGIAEFGESACERGSLGVLPAKEIMPLVLACAGRLARYGA